jgi:hypothetical protein
MSELFDIYQDNIKTVFSRITRILDNINTLSSDKAQIALDEAEVSLKEAERLVNINSNF